MGESDVRVSQTELFVPGIYICLTCLLVYLHFLEQCLHWLLLQGLNT